MAYILGENLTHNMGTFSSTNLTLNIRGAFLGKNLTHNMEAFSGTNLRLNMGEGPF